MTYTPLPIGIDDFEEIIVKKNYYVDKTLLIKDLLDKMGKVNLFTRPRRFGKTLNLSMLKYFFEKPINEQSNKHLFDGMKIMAAGEKYTSEQEQYPVITLTLKSAKQGSYKNAFDRLKETIANEYKRHRYIMDTLDLESDQELFLQIMSRTAEDGDYFTSLAFLSQCLYEYHQKKVIILIDEYDVPLENSYYRGFYDQMVDFIRSLFESALKTNPYLEFSVITGCLRISKESIFTGLNNLKIISILNENYGEHFGFVEEEVKEMLAFYHRENKMDTMKRWYNGYLFGNKEVYNPWSVIHFTERIVSNENAFPVAAWSNSSSNSIVRDLIERANTDVQREIEALMNGGTIEKIVHEEITYGDIYQSEENLWNFLFFTGYLKQVSTHMEDDDVHVQLAIPNREVHAIYRNQIRTWFREEVEQTDLSPLYHSMLEGTVENFEQELGKQLRKTISYMDSSEGFYHGFLLGLMANLHDYATKSNRESGDGRYDICIYNADISLPPILIEIKCAKRFKELGEACEKALAQIEAKHYAEELAEEGYSEVICYGIGFFKKQVKVQMIRKQLESV